MWVTAHPETVLTDFETYNLAESGTAGSLFLDGLNFGNNAYEFGTINLSEKSITKKAGLTGTLKTIMILPD